MTRQGHFQGHQNVELDLIELLLYKNERFDGNAFANAGICLLKCAQFPCNVTWKKTKLNMELLQQQNCLTGINNCDGKL